MRVDKDDRYVTEAPKKSPDPVSKLDFLEGISKSKLVIAALIVIIILLLLSLVIFRTSHKSGLTPLTPPTVNEETTTDSKTDDLINSAYTGSNDSLNSSNSNGDLSSNVNRGNATEDLQNQSSATNSQTVAPISQLPQESTALKVQEDDIVTTSNNVISNSNIVAKPISPAPIATDKTVTKAHTSKKTTSHHTGNHPLASNEKIADNHFVIQLSASTSEKKLKEFAIKHNIAGYQIYQTTRNSKPWFILIKGNYASSHAAKEAIKSLPAALQKNRPWVKSGAAVNKDKQ